MLRIQVLLLLFLFIVLVRTQDQCYCRSSSKVFVCVLGVPCGEPNAAGFSSCCAKGDTCGKDGLCRYTHAQTGISGYYMGHCTDPTYSDTSCPSPCTDNPTQDAVYNSTSGLWACCNNKPGGAVDCSETFRADSPKIMFATASPSFTIISFSSAAVFTTLGSTFPLAPLELNTRSILEITTTLVLSPSTFTLSASAPSSTDQSLLETFTFSGSPISPSSSFSPESTTPSSSPASINNSSNNNTTELSQAAKIAIAVLSTIVCAILIAAAIYTLRRRRSCQHRLQKQKNRLQQQQQLQSRLQMQDGSSSSHGQRELREMISGHLHGIRDENGGGKKGKRDGNGKGNGRSELSTARVGAGLGEGEARELAATNTHTNTKARSSVHGDDKMIELEGSSPLTRKWG